MLSIDEIKRLLTYNPDDGSFVWNIDISSRAMKGCIAGTLVNGYLCITIKNNRYQAHQLAYAITKGEWPDSLIDHKDCDTSNNRWLNLRKATNSQNAYNSTISSRNTTGIKGVSFDKSRGLYRARIDVDGKAIRLGRFDTLEQAELVIIEARRLYHKEFANNG